MYRWRYINDWFLIIYVMEMFKMNNNQFEKSCFFFVEGHFSIIGFASSARCPQSSSAGT